MCGIAGLLALDARPTIDRDLLERMTDSLAHRGPDGRGVWTGAGVGFGHRRLAIVDPEGGPQPWVDKGRGIALTYNGELYNQAPLRRILEQEGVTFRSSCDTEVLFEALARWGVDETLRRARGMYAFAFWEAGPRRLTLARDPLGVKPLYWAMRGGTVRFGSEIKAILADPSFPRDVDVTSLVHYLGHYRLTFRGRTLFKQVNEVEAGTYVQWEGRRKSVTRYWQYPRIREQDKRDLGARETAMAFRDQMIRSVRRRLMADVPVGAYLSGGIDSAVIVTLMRGLKHPDLRTFSIGFEQQGYNEFSHSRTIARNLGVKHHEVTMTEEGYFRHFQELIGIKDTPLSVPNEVPLRFLSRHLKKRVTVVLSGEGADELLGGYQLLVRSPHDFLLAKALEEGGDSIPADLRGRIETSLMQLYGTTKFSSQREQFLGLYQWVPKREREALFSAHQQWERAEAEIADHWEEVWAELDAADLDPYEKVLHILEETHLSALLLRLDATTMAEGVEGRVPYTDRDLVEWVATLPVHYKLRWKGEAEQQQAAAMTSVQAAGKLDVSKYLLRMAFAGEIPEQILWRPKTAFPTPLDDWFYGARNQWARERAITPQMETLFNREAMEKMFSASRGRQEGMKLWMLTNIGLWLDSYFSG